MKLGTWLLLAVTLMCLVGLVSCGGGEGGNGNGGIETAVTGEIYGRSGGTFVPLGGQGVAIGNRTATSQANTGRFTITGIPAGPFVVVVTPLPGFGEVLNPEVLAGVAVNGQTVDIGRVLLGQRPPDPGI